MVEQQSLVQQQRRSVNAKSLTERAAAGGLGGGVVASFFLGASGAAIGIPLAIASFAGLLLFARRKVRRFNLDNQFAMDALNRGEIAKAHDVWNYWGDVRDNKQIKVVAWHNLAVVWSRQGKLDDARKLHQETTQSYVKPLRRLGLTQLSAASVAHCYALLGELDTANKWLAIAETAAGEPQVPNAKSTMVQVRVIVELRHGHAEEAAKILDDNWQMIEGRIVALDLRTYRLLRAFARSAVGPREAGRAQEDLDTLRPRYPGEHSFLCTQWPEMAAFLATHGLA